MSSGPVETIVYSNSGLIRIAKHAVCDEMEQAAISLGAAYPQFSPIFKGIPTQL